MLSRMETAASEEKRLTPFFFRKMNWLPSCSTGALSPDIHFHATSTHEGRRYSPEAAGHHSLKHGASEGMDVSTSGCGECVRAQAFLSLLRVSPAACSQVAAATARSRSQRREVKKKKRKKTQNIQ